MTDAIHPSTQKVIEAAKALEMPIQIKAFDQSTRTAPEAADAIGCQLGQIVKSLCFTVNDAPVMALVSGNNQLDTKKLATLFNVGKKKVKRADAQTVKQATGFSIGGVPPFGHTHPMLIYVDADLLTYDEVWAAAGTPHTVFPIPPQKLVSISGGTVADLKKE